MDKTLGEIIKGQKTQVPFIRKKLTNFEIDAAINWTEYPKEVIMSKWRSPDLIAAKAVLLHYLFKKVPNYSYWAKIFNYSTHNAIRHAVFRCENLMTINDPLIVKEWSRFYSNKKKHDIETVKVDVFGENDYFKY